MPNDRLNVSQITTMGAKRLPILDVPRGWIKNSSIKMAHEVPTIVAELILASTTWRLDYRSASEHIERIQPGKL